MENDKFFTKRNLNRLKTSVYGYIAKVYTDILAALVKKQDKLTEGTNIEIEDNVISANVIDDTVTINNTNATRKTWSVNKIIAYFGSPMKFKGQVATIADLDTIGELESGDVYNVIEDNNNYCYVESQGDWIIIGNADLNFDDYYKKDEADALLDAKQDTLVSGTNIVTVNSKSLLAAGNLATEYIVKDVATAGTGVTIINSCIIVRKCSATLYVTFKVTSARSTEAKLFSLNSTGMKYFVSDYFNGFMPSAFCFNNWSSTTSNAQIQFLINSSGACYYYSTYSSQSLVTNNQCAIQLTYPHNLSDYLNVN